MAVVTVRSLSDETHRALKLRAAQHGRSTEAEIRDILDQTVRPEQRVRLGSALAEFGRKSGGIELNITRDPSSIKPASFE